MKRQETFISIADMARHVWFSLIPTNEASEAIVNDARNHEHVAIVFEPEAASGKIIQVYFGNNLTSNCILSFGRHLECNILCDPPGTAIGRQMSQIHCSFLLSNGCLILRDYSGRCKTTISPVHLNYPGKWHMDGLPRQRAIPEHGDWHISVGPATFLLRFRQGMHKLDSLIISLLKLMAIRCPVVGAEFG